MWCKQLEFLVANYLVQLTKFAGGNIAKQISSVASSLINHGEWAKEWHHLFALLMGLDPVARNDPRVKEAIRLIEEVCKAPQA
jgi:hypothetical protein